VDGIFDKKLVDLDEDLLIELANQGLGFVKDKNYEAPAGGLIASTGKTIFVNSEGLDLEETSSRYSQHIEVKKKDAPGWWFSDSNSFSEKYLEVVKDACKMAELNNVKDDIKTCKCDVVLHPFACYRMLSNGVYPLFNSDYVQKGKSPYAGKIGELIASKNLTIYDDGILPNGLNSGSFDGDGVPCQKTPLVEKGVLRNFIYDLTRAQKEGVKSTGNAARAHYSPPHVSISNFYIEPGQKDLVKEIDKGLIVYMPLNAHSIDPVTGHFSLGVDVAFWVEKGEIKFAPKNVMISGSVQDFLKNIKEIGNDFMQTGKYAGPSLMGELSVTGS